MIEQFIDYIAHQPTDITSPLYLALNTAAMLTAQFGDSATSDRVTLYDANAQAGNTPYVKLSDQGKRARMATFLGGSYLEVQTLECMCVAIGTTPQMAVNKAEYLKLAVEGEIKKLQAGIMALTTRLDLGGTSSTEKIVNVQISSAQQETPVQGQSSQYTATRTALIDLWVSKVRSI